MGCLVAIAVLSVGFYLMTELPRDQAGEDPKPSVSTSKVVSSKPDASTNEAWASKRVHGFTPLMRAAYQGQDAEVQRLIKRRHYVNRQTTKGTTALMAAAVQGHTEAVWLLVEAGADMNIQNNDGYTALMLALGQWKMGAFRLLLEAGADVDKQEKETGATALLQAVVLGNREAVRLLIAAGTDQGKKTYDGFTAAMLAATNGKTEILKILESHRQSGDVKGDIQQWAQD